MYATYAVTSTTPKWAILTAASSPAPPSKTSPKTGYAPSVESPRKTSTQSKNVILIPRLRSLTRINERFYIRKRPDKK